MQQIDQFSHYINGHWCSPDNDEWIDTVNPATGNTWARIARGNKKDAELAVESASRAFYQGEWSDYSQQQRAQALIRIADRLERDWPQLVDDEVRDNGKRISEVRAQFSALHLWYRHFASQLLEINAHPLENDTPGVVNHLHYEPFGVVAAITPWNSPLMIASWKIGPALAAGNTVVIKPSEHASVSTLKFAALMTTAGLPKGVVNVICGYGHEVGEALVSDERVSKVTFTGSDAGGRSVAKSSARGIKPVTLELGGKSPQIVFADADIENTINGVLSGIFLSGGQTCVAGSRLLVQAPVYDQFLDRLVSRVSRLKVGDPFDEDTDMGPMANQAHFNKVLAMIDTAREQGAHCVYGGKQVHLPEQPDGYFVLPTLFTHVERDMQLWREEVFGPVLAIRKFDDEHQALSMANDSDYGLAAGIWTGDEEKAQRLATQINAGTIYINHYRSVNAGSPIGGYKLSGYGRELGPRAIHDFLQVKSVWKGTQPIANPFPT